MTPRYAFFKVFQWQLCFRTQILLVSLVNCVALMRTTASGQQCAELNSDGGSKYELSSENGVGMKFVWFPSGTFMMGKPISEHLQAQPLDFDSAIGQHEVLLSRGFWMGQTEVTQCQWKKIMQTEPWTGKYNVREGARFPATFVSWFNAVEFCQKLTQSERSNGLLAADREYTLPTEAEWEFACRAGTETTYSFGDGDANLPNYAWFGLHFSSEPSAHEVGKKQPNSAGLFDMHGNCAEWCIDGFDLKLEGGVDPRGAIESNLRVYRGGSWASSSANIRSDSRAGDSPKLRNSGIGFRVVIRDVAENGGNSLFSRKRQAKSRQSK